MLFARIIIGALGFLTWDWVRAEDRNMLPTILYHTPTAQVVHLEDLLELSVDVQGEAIGYRWFRGDELVCQAAMCRFDTKGWEIGNHTVTMIAYNRYGSTSLRYLIRALARDTSREPRLVKQEVIAFSGPHEHLLESDYYVHAARGIGYSSHSSKVQVLGQVPRLLEWQERLRTQPQAVVRFGKSGVEEHFVMEQSLVSLLASDSGRRIIHLEKGSLRSRKLNETEASWSLAVGDWLQIDLDQLADVVVQLTVDETGQSVAQVSVLRGVVKVFQTKSSVSDRRSVPHGKEFELSAGLAREFIEGNPPRESVWLQGESVSRWLRRTTPFYLNGRKKVNSSVELLSAKRPTSREFDQVVDEVAERLDRYDPLYALELMQPFQTEGARHPLFLYYWGQAYQQLGIIDRARRFYQRVLRMDPNHPQTNYQLGTLALRDREWSRAHAYFRKAKDAQIKPTGILNYYQGIASSGLGLYSEAQREYQLCVELTTESSLRSSCEAHLGNLHVDKWYVLSGVAGLRFDSNVIRLKPGEAHEDKVASTGSGLAAEFNALFRALRYDHWDMNVVFELSRRGYFDRRQQDFETFRQSVALPYSYFAGDHRDEARFAFHLRPKVEMLYLGKARALDTLGADLEFALPSTVLHPSLHLDYQHQSDPLPFTYKSLDPVRWEPVGLSDRSATRYSFGLSSKLAPSLHSVWVVMLAQSSQGYVEEFSKIDNHRDTSVKLSYQRFQADQSALSLIFGYTSRNYTENHSTDRLLNVQGLWRPMIHEVLFADTWFEWHLLEAADGKRSFNRFDLGTGFGIRF